MKTMKASGNIVKVCKVLWNISACLLNRTFQNRNVPVMSECLTLVLFMFPHLRSFTAQWSFQIKSNELFGGYDLRKEMLACSQHCELPRFRI